MKYFSKGVTTWKYTYNIYKCFMQSNPKIKIAPSVDKGRILIRILVTCLFKGLRMMRREPLRACSGELSHILKEWHRYSPYTINKYGFRKWPSSPEHA